METVLKVERLSKNSILHEISFEMGQGEMVAVMGSSGSGESTLLYNVAGMDQPSDGKVWLKDTEVTGLSEDAKACLRLHRMGFVFQQMNMMANLNILDNILLPAVQATRKSIRGSMIGGKNPSDKSVINSNTEIPQRSRRELIMAARGLMQKLSISGLEERRITQVSGGQLQRACICRSMMNSPEILFADEPTGTLDKSAADEVMNELVKLNQEGTAILIVTHDSRVASRCNRILYLLDGRICGELKLGEVTVETEKQREERTGRWLMKMGW